MTELSHLLTKEPRFNIRPSSYEDVKFITVSWLRGLYYGNSFFEDIPHPIFEENYRHIIGKLLLKDGTQVNVACLPDATDVILGYAVYTNENLHWVFVKDSWRKLGIAKQLVPQNIKTCSHLSKIGRSLRVKYNVIFNPFNL